MTHIVRLPVDTPLVVGRHVRPRTGAGLSYVQGLRDDVEEWLADQGITRVRLRMSSNRQSFEVIFEDEVEAVAFRMRW